MLLLAVIMPMMWSCSSTPRSFEDLNDIPGVNNVYLGPGLMTMASGISNLAGGKVANLSKNVTSFRLINVDNAKAVKRVRPFIKKQIKELGLSSMFNTNKGNGEQFAVYTKQSATNPDQYTDLVLVTDVADKMVVMFLKGNFTAAQISDVTAD